MKGTVKRLVGFVVSISLLAGLCVGFSLPAAAAAKSPQYQETARLMEELNRGLIATYRTVDSRSVLSGEGGVYLSWRLLGTESLSNQAFDIYRSTNNGTSFTKLATTGAHAPTNYIDTSGTASYLYKVVKAGAASADVAAEKAVAPGENHTAKGSEIRDGNSEKNSFTYVDIPISRPADVTRYDGKTSRYYSYDSSHEGGANDASVGDLDGDGDYEIVLKWDPTDSKDSAGADFTGRVYIDAYEIDPNNTGYKWRIDLGPNITAGAHYTQYIVYDFDGDGCAEIAMATAPGTVDGTGHYVSEAGDTDAIRNVDNTKSYIGTSGSTKGRNMGPEYYTIFEGETGKALWTTAAIPLGTSSEWGDSKYNRASRFLAGVAYLDGIHPSYIACRGYYDKAVLRAYSWDGETMSLEWEHMGNVNNSSTMYGQGNHSLSVADIDNDGKDEIVYGSASLDDDGKKVLGNTRLGHGDALHVSDFNNDGVQEAFSVKEEKSGYTKYAADLRTPKDGKHFWDSGKIVTTADNGRGVMANLDDAYAKEHPEALALGWDSGHANVHTLYGDDLNAKPSFGSRTADNSLVYWDGDLGREILDDNIIGKYYADTGWTRRFYSSDGYTLTGGSSNNYTKRNASLSADIWGDWREEVILPINKSSNTEQAYLRIYTSTIWTDYRLTTLMHDAQYRCAIAWQNVGYNQPPHTSYYIGSAALATDSNGNELNYLAPATAYTSVTYSIEGVAVTGISIPEASLNVEKGSTASIAYQIEPADASRRGVNWTSSNDAVAAVSGGVVKGVSEGSATITATTKDGGYTATCNVTVYQTHTTGVKLSNSELQVGVGYSKAVTANVEPANATDKTVTWTSSDQSVATVDSDGNITGVKQGTATITATTVDGGYKANCTVSVLPLKNIDITGADTFVTDNTDANTAFSTTATSASFNMADASYGARFYKSFTPCGNSVANLSFRLVTGGKKYDDTNWNWTGHEYSLKVRILGENGDNILTLTQPYGTGSSGGAGKLTAGILDKAAENVEQTWYCTEVGNIQGSAKRWIVNLEFDYDNDLCTPVIIGCDSSWNETGRIYYDSFALDGASLGELSVEIVKDGTGTIKAAPTVSELSYILTEIDDGSEDTRPTLAPTASPAPTPTPTPRPVVEDLTGFVAKSRMAVSDPEGSEKTVTFTAGSNANNAVGYALCDYSAYVEGQDKYIIEYDSMISSGSRARIALVDAASRPGTSKKDAYDKTGVAFNHGVTDSSSYVAMESKSTGNAPSARDNWVHTSVTVDTVNKTVTYIVTSQDGTKLLSNNNVSYLDTALEAPNGIEFLDTINSSVGYMKNVQITTYKEYDPSATPEPTALPTATPAPTPTPTPMAVATNLTAFTAKTRTTVSGPAGTENTITFTAGSSANNATGAAYCDYSEYVAGADEYIVEYDSMVPSSSRARVALCDVSQRPGSSNKNSYDKTGIAFVQGVVDSSSYAAMENKTLGNAAGARDNWVHTRVEVNTVDKTLSYTVTAEDSTKLLSGTNVSYLDTALEAPNGIEFLDTINSSVGYMKNVKVTVYKDYDPSTEPTPTPAPTATPTPAPEPIVAKLIVATYDTNGMLLSTEISTYNYVKSTSEESISASLAENQIAFIWYDMVNIKPVCDAIKPKK